MLIDSFMSDDLDENVPIVTEIREKVSSQTY